MAAWRLAALRTLATRYPLVILSNASDQQIALNVARLGAPFHRVLTAEQARVYKPRLAAFLYLFDALGCRAKDFEQVRACVSTALFNNVYPYPFSWYTSRDK